MPAANSVNPITFTPILKERIWGGTRIISHLGRPLPPEGGRIGESWEVCDRTSDQSLINHGPLAGTSLNDLWKHHRSTIFGKRTVRMPQQRFPLLFKILDATDTLSVQVHPAENVSPHIHAEPKTEAWHLLDATPNACVYAGFRAPGLSKDSLRKHLKKGSFEALLNRIPVNTGDRLLIPSGRCHAIGAGCLIAEIQQNSDTTYRIFDWNRTDSDGRSRDLHVDQALDCIDLDDVAPSLLPRDEPVISDFFRLETIRIPPNKEWKPPQDEFALVHLIAGAISQEGRHFSRGNTMLIPAALTEGLRTEEAPCIILQITLP